MARASHDDLLTLAQLEERWGAPWYEAFGMTETGGDLRVFEREQEFLGTAK